MDYPLVYIVVLNWNGYEETAGCLSSLFKMDYPNYRIVVVDNGSMDDSLARLQIFADRITLLKSETNLGYTGGNNLGARHALANGAEYVWFLNNDTVIPSDGLTKLVACAMEGQIDLGSPVIYYADWPGRVWFCSYNFDLASCACRPTTDIETARAWQRDEPNRVALVGTALLIRRAVFQAIGMLDDRFFAYCEDIDYCIRSAEAGFRNAVVFNAAVYHKKAPDGPANFLEPHVYYFMARNEFLMWRKYASGVRRLKMILGHLKRMLWRIEQLVGNPVGKQACLAGMWDGWNGVTGEFDSDRRMPQPLRAVIASISRLITRLRSW